MKKMKILVTGGTGLVGSRLLKRMVGAGVDCRAIVRPGKMLPTGIAAVEGDLLYPASLKAAVEDVSAIVHLAAVLRTQEEADIWEANVVGTRTSSLPRSSMLQNPASSSQVRRWSTTPIVPIPAAKTTQ
jgi:nucleoside-diphosphate-sugar epimerase